MADLERGLTEEVPGAVEMLRCPTCLNRLATGGEKRCPECGTRIRTGRRANVLTDDVVFKRPRGLVERELQARIEAQTAPHFRQRRRAAKAARRIASLPSSVFESGAITDADTGAWNPAPMPVVIDIPVTAIHETARVVELPPAPDDGVAAPRPRWRPWKASHNGHDAGAPGEPVGGSTPTAAVYDYEADDDAAVAAPHDTFVSRVGNRWRAWRSARATAETDDEAATAADAAEGGELHTGELDTGELDSGELDAGEANGLRGAHVPRFGDRWRTWKPIPRDTAAADSNGDAVAEEPTPAAPPPPPPKPARHMRSEPREVSPAARAPRGAENWEPSNSLWANRVFSNSRGTQYASWPHPRPAKSDVSEPAAAD